MLAKSCKMARHFWVDHSEKWRNFFGGTPQKMTGTERVNDINEYCGNANLFLYADDSTLLFGGNKEQLELRVTEAIQKLIYWLKDNNFSLNVEKTKQVNFLTKNNTLPPISLNIYNKKVENCETLKFLGLTLDNKLTWSNHITNLCKKLSNANYALRTLVRIMKNETVMIAYHGYFASLLAYGIELWGSSTFAKQVFKIQKRAVRIITNTSVNTSCRGLFKSLGILTVPSLYIYKVILYSKLKCKVSTVGEMHTYFTRFGNLQRTPTHHLSLYEKRITYAGIKFFNQLPNEMRQITSINKFKHILKMYLIKNEYYSIEDFLHEKIYE